MFALEIWPQPLAQFPYPLMAPLQHLISLGVASHSWVADEAGRKSTSTQVSTRAGMFTTFVFLLVPCWHIEGKSLIAV